MKGEDEGVFAWITTNYLLGKIDGGDETPTAAIFDLGGGSTQIAFQPVLDELEVRHKGSASAYELNFQGKRFQLYQHSHLGYGLMSARAALHRLVLDRSYKQNASLKSWLSRPVENPCIPPGNRVKITVEMPSDHPLMGEHEVIMRGPVEADPAQCRTLTEAILNKDKPCSISPCSINGVYQPSLEETLSEDVYLFSYFYDRTHKLGMPDSFTLNELHELASKVCAGERTWASAFGHVKGALQSLKEMPEWCLDLTFMESLLHKGYEMPMSRRVKIASQIRGNEIGWCLGASLTLLERGSGWQCRRVD